MAGFGNAAIVCLIGTSGEVASVGWGSSGLATKKLHGISEQSFTVVERVEPVPMVGYYGASPLAEEVQQSGEFALSGVATYQEMPKFLNGFFTFSSASTGAADPYDYYWSAPVASTQANATYPLEFGTSTRSYVSRGSVFNDLTLSGEAGGLMQFQIGGFSKGIYTTTGLSTAANADARTMNPVSMKDVSFRVDSFTSGWTASFNSSSGELSAQLISFELTFNPNRHAKMFAGSAQAGGWGDARNEASLVTVLEFTTKQREWLDSLLPSSTASGASTGAVLQKLVGLHASAASTFGSSGFTFDIGFAGIVAEPIQLWSDRDGNATVSLTWAGKYSTAFSMTGTSGGNYLGFKICSSSSAITS